MVTSQSEIWIGHMLDGRYDVTEKIGAGGMGTVYRAIHRNIDADVVIKVPDPLMVRHADYGARFEREIGALVRLSHPHIVKVIDLGQHEGLPFAVLQYLPGGNLEDRRPHGPNGNPLPIDPVLLLAWLPDIASAIDYVHSQGFVHRDIKPSNILFDENDFVFLGDFGLAKVLAAEEEEVDNKLTKTGRTLGTHAYMAPEVLISAAYKTEYDHRVDQYALAVTVFKMLCGRVPYEGDLGTIIAKMMSAKSVPQLQNICPSIPEEISQTVARALSRNPQKRFSSCAAFAVAFSEAVHGTSSSAKPAKLPASLTDTSPEQPITTVEQLSETSSQHGLPTARKDQPTSSMPPTQSNVNRADGLAALLDSLHKKPAEFSRYIRVFRKHQNDLPEDWSNGTRRERLRAWIALHETFDEIRLLRRKSRFFSQTSLRLGRIPKNLAKQLVAAADHFRKAIGVKASAGDLRTRTKRADCFFSLAKEVVGRALVVPDDFRRALTKVLMNEESHRAVNRAAKSLGAHQIAFMVGGIVSALAVMVLWLNWWLG